MAFEPNYSTFTSNFKRNPNGGLLKKNPVTNRYRMSFLS